MPPPTSSRSIDPRLASASGVMRDTVGAIHNLSHLLGSMRVGPKALARVIPDVRASCAPMIEAAAGLVAATEGANIDTRPIADLGRLISARMTELDTALGRIRSATLRAGDRLGLETLVARVIPDLDGALELVDLLAEASATSSVPVDVTDVIRESMARPDATAGRAAGVIVSFAPPKDAVVVKANPRLAMRLLVFAVALTARRGGGVAIQIERDATHCKLALSAATPNGAGKLVLTPTLIDLSLPFVARIAIGAGAALEAETGAGRATLTLPVAASE